jgi:hypothetical protein
MKMKVTDFSKSQLKHLKSLVHAYMEVLTDEAVEHLTAKNMEPYEEIKAELADCEILYNRIELGFNLHNVNDPEFKATA